MKKLILLTLAVLTLGLTVNAQDGQILKKNFTVQKGIPTIRLIGATPILNFGTVGGKIDFYNAGASDVTIEHSANQLAIRGGDLSLSVNSLKMTGSIGETGNRIAKGWFTDLEVTNGAVLTGGYTITNASPVIWAKGGSTVLATSGTDVACSNGARWWVEVDIPYNVELTGIAYLVGSVGGTDSVVVQLHNSAGVQVATSKRTGANHGMLVGTAAQFQSCAFYEGTVATHYMATAGKYYVSVQFNGTTAKFRTYPIPGSKFITGTAAGTWNTKADITPGTTFTADKGPIVMTY